MKSETDKKFDGIALRFTIERALILLFNTYR